MRMSEQILLSDIFDLVKEYEEYNTPDSLLADGLVVMGEMYQSVEGMGRREAKAEELRIIMGVEA